MNNKTNWLIAALIVFFGCIIVLGVGYAFRSRLCENGMTLACNVGVAQAEEPVTEEIPSSCTIANLNAMPDATNMVFSADASCSNGVEWVVYSYQMLNGVRADQAPLDAAHKDDDVRVPLTNFVTGSSYQLFVSVLEIGATTPITEAKDFKVEAPAAVTPEFTAEPSATPTPSPTPTHLPFGTVTLTTDKDEIDLGDSFTLTVVLAGDVTCTWTDGSTVVSGATKVITPTVAGSQRYGFSPDATSKCVDSNGINITSFVSVTVNPALAITATATPSVAASNSAASKRETFNFDYPNAGTITGENFTISGLPVSVDPSNVLVATGSFTNTLGWGSQMSVAAPGTLLVGPGFPQDKVNDADGSIEYISPVNQKLIDHDGEEFHVNEDRITICSFGSAKVEVNGVLFEFEYIENHTWIWSWRGLFGDGIQGTDRNQTIKFIEVAGSHAQCMSYPQNGGGFWDQGNFEQVVLDAHFGLMNCGDAGCAGVTSGHTDLNTGAYTTANQPKENESWNFISSNWWTQP